MVGGSSLIRHVREAVEKYFNKSAVGFFQDSLAIQFSVARGAASGRCAGLNARSFGKAGQKLLKTMKSRGDPLEDIPC